MRTLRGPVLRVLPDVTPMLGVMLVVLIIFMVFVPASLAYFDVDVPKAQHVHRYPKTAGDRTLGVDRDGNYYFNERPVRAEALAAALRASFARGPHDVVLYIRADKYLEYGPILNALQIARENGARVVGLVAEERQLPR